MNWQTEYLPYGFCVVLAKPVSAASCSWHILCSCPITKQYFYGYLPSSVQVPMIFPKSVFWMALLYNLFFGLFICVKIFIDIFAHIEIVHFFIYFLFIFYSSFSPYGSQRLWHTASEASHVIPNLNTLPPGKGWEYLPTRLRCYGRMQARYQILLLANQKPGLSHVTGRRRGVASY